MLPASDVRDAITQALPSEIGHGSDDVEPRFIYVPPAHVRALSPNTMLVLGIRGAGKTLWWQALQTQAVRERVIEASSRAGLAAIAHVRAGFGSRPDPDAYPDRDTLERIVKRHDPRQLWRAVFLWAVSDERCTLPPLTVWTKRVEWVEDHPEVVARTLHDLDRRHAAEGSQVMVLFDALDRTAQTHQGRIAVLRGLLELLLDVRELRALRAKAFLRPDMLDDPEARAFPDASKLLTDAVDLRWSAQDLYALFFLHIGNAQTQERADHPGAIAFRAKFFGDWRAHEGGWLLPDALTSEPHQARVMDALSGRWMGTNQRRGRVYTWLPKHLADGRQQVSPRSFLVALRAAAEHTDSEHRLPLAWRAIRRGVGEASWIRRNEIIEDHPWVEFVADALEGLSVPVERKHILERWSANEVMRRIRDMDRTRGTLPPHLEDGPDGLLRDLEDLGVFHSLRDGRLQVPDVYRIGFKMLRRGGVPALPR